MKIVIRFLTDHEWDLRRIPSHCRRADIDAHLRRVKKGYELDVFNASVRKAEDAWLDCIEINRSPSGPNWNQVLIALREFEIP